MASPVALSTRVEVGVVGAGTMGADIAQVAAMAGHHVQLLDARAGAADAAIVGIRASLDRLVAKGRLGDKEAAAAGNAIRSASTVADFATCGLVIEAIVEDLGTKRALLQEIEAAVGVEAFIATNTSSLSITALGAELQHAERFAGVHFFNPATLMPLVEIVSGAGTSAETARVLYATVARWGKVPVFSRSSPGFVVNRVARPFYAEALRVLEEGAADYATLDAIMRESGGFRMGPFELMDLIGHDVNYAVTRSVFDAFYGDSRFTPSLRQLEMVQAGHFGHKTGQGFYDYRVGAVPVQAATHAQVTAPASVIVYGHDGFVERLAKAPLMINRRESHDDGRLAECGTCVLYRSDGRTATLRAAVTGIRNTIVVDLCFDFKAFTRIAITAADQCDRSAMLSVVGLLQAAGLAVSVLEDVPGMIVLRTVAMLANEAADAVNQSVCTAEDCDLAMRKGVNYPRGPLAWAEQLGLTQIVEVLDHLSQAYGEDRYRVSPLLRRKALAGGSFLNREGAEVPEFTKRVDSHAQPESLQTPIGNRRVYE